MRHRRLSTCHLFPESLPCTGKLYIDIDRLNEYCLPHINRPTLANSTLTGVTARNFPDYPRTLCLIAVLGPERALRPLCNLAAKHDRKAAGAPSHPAKHISTKRAPLYQNASLLACFVIQEEPHDVSRDPLLTPQPQNTSSYPP